VQQAVGIKGVVDAAAFVHAEGETHVLPARPDHLAVALRLLGCGTVFFRQVFTDVLAFGRHLRVEFKGLEMYLGLDFAGDPAQRVFE